ncbi:MAG: ornithine carbamoyltransferase [Nanoarchaeota archaeon]
MRHLLNLNDLEAQEIFNIITLAQKIKKNPDLYNKVLHRKTLIMLFEKPSLRTRLSFEIGMTHLGGHAIYYDVTSSPLHKGKESLSDTAKVMSRMADIIMARTYSHEKLEEFAGHSEVPVINGLTDLYHPCQILGDLLTIKEKKNTLKASIAYYGDCRTNVANSWMLASKKLNFKLILAGPNKPLKELFDKTKSNVTWVRNPKKVQPTDVVYTDSWMSYNIPAWKKTIRQIMFKKYQVNSNVMKRAKKNAIFMHDMPAIRGMEVTTEVIDGKQSIILDQAENRLHIEKAILIWLLKHKAY